MKQLNFLGAPLFDEKGDLLWRSKTLFWFAAAIVAVVIVCLLGVSRGVDLASVLTMPLWTILAATFVALPIEFMIVKPYFPKYKHFGQPIATYMLLILGFLLLFSGHISTDLNPYMSLPAAIYKTLTYPESIIFFHAPIIIYICINGFVSKYAIPARKQTRTDILDDL